jgi:uridine kinase
MNNLIIGIAGGSGSGKTTLALRLKERFGEDEVRLISHDSYYKRHDELPFEERCKLNYDHPDAFDNALLIYHLQELKAGRAIDCPVYDYSNHNRSDKVQHIEPAPVLIVEGILPFVEPSKRNADIIVPNGGENTTAIEMLAHHIRSLIEKANMV